MYSAIIFPTLTLVILHQLSNICDASVSTSSNHNSTGNSEHTKAQNDTKRRRPRGRVPDMECIPAEIQPEDNHTASIIFLHTYGQSGFDWSHYIRRIRQPYMRIICPHANNMEFRLQNMSQHQKPSWFEFNDTHYLQDYDHPNGMGAMTLFIHTLIEKEIRCGIPPERIILGGICQGGSVALHSALTYPKRLGGIMTLSTWLPDNRLLKEYLEPAQMGIPILLLNLVDIHEDEVYDSGRHIHDFLLDHVSNNTEYKKFDHGEGNPADKVREFLAFNVPYNETYREVIKPADLYTRSPLEYLKELRGLN